MSDRAVFATSPDDSVQIVRYDRAGKWYSERADGLRQLLTVREAARAAIDIMDAGGYVRSRGLGGVRFDDECAKILRARP
jgi:hypothetical protein